MSDLAQHANQILAWRSDPVSFVRFAMQVEPDVWQAEALLDLAEHDRLAIRSGHGVGKSAFLSWAIIWWMITRYPAKVACTAPTSHQLEDVLWSELAHWHRRMRPELAQLLEVKVDSVLLTASSKESFAVARTARRENPEAFQGFHSQNMLFVVDEASGVDDIIFEVGSGSMSTPGAKTVLVGNPTRTSGYFYDAFHRMRELWRCRKVSCFDAKQVSPAYMKLQEAKYGLDSNAYRVRVLGEFPTADDSTVMALDILEAAVDRDVAPCGGKTVWGLDVARFGDDLNALAKRRKNRLLEPIRSWGKKDLMQTSGMVVAEYEKTPYKERPDIILVDSIGLGAGVVDRLKEQGLPVRGINVAESPSIADHYLRLRDELWWKAREWFAGLDVSIPRDDDLIGELSVPRYHYSSTGKIQVERKDELKARGVKSPNLADAFNLTFAIGETSVARFSKKIEYQKARFV